MFDIKFSGERLIDAKFRQLEDIGTYHRPMQDSTRLLQHEMQIYPPELPNQKYIRTFALRRGWFTRETVQGGDLVGEVGNAVRYAPQVQEVEEQKPIHQGRWQTTRSVLQEQTARIVGIFENWISRTITR